MNSIEHFFPVSINSLQCIHCLLHYLKFTDSLVLNTKEAGDMNYELLRHHHDPNAKQI